VAVSDVWIHSRYPSTVNTTSTIILGAHYDSRGSFGSMRAPGANDNGSGTIALLAIARTIGRKGMTFRSNVELIAFAGEEQGLLGSRAYAS
jgi:Zn-dependent M28 family amino/carboxypeptidase